jgi:hypothetical protein
MRPRQYHFVTVWQLTAPLIKVWPIIADAGSWPQWWRGVKSVTAKSTKTDGVGSIIDYTWKGYLPYQLSFRAVITELVPGKRIVIDVTGDLVGQGIWAFQQHGSITEAHYDWRVVTTKWWMNFIAPLARGIFHHSHNWVMHQGAIGLARQLNCNVDDTN